MSNTPPPAILQSPLQRHESIWREQPPGFYDYDPATESPSYGTGSRAHYSPVGHRPRYRSAPMTPSYSHRQQDYYEYWQAQHSPHDSPLPHPSHYHSHSHWSNLNPTHSPESNPWNPPPYDYDGNKTLPPIHRGYREDFSPPGTPGTSYFVDQQPADSDQDTSHEEMLHQEDDSTEAKNNGDGDPLRILASVSADMTDDEKRMKADGQPMPAPTSPLQRSAGQADPEATQSVETPKQRPKRRQITPSSTRTRQTRRSKARPPVGPVSTRSQKRNRSDGAEQNEHDQSEVPPSQRPVKKENQQSREQEVSPALVERSSSSFESDQGERHHPGHSPSRRGYHPFSDERSALPPPGPPHHSHYHRYHPHSYGYWSESSSHLHSHPRAPAHPPSHTQILPPPPSSVPSRGPYIPPRWGYDQSTPSYEYQPGGPASSRPMPLPTSAAPSYRAYSYPAQHAAPYTYVQQPRLEEKTVLRKKFSWKHYPELERFLIANRDDYLKHSSMNYTAEQKQYNNRLTECLLEVAAQHNYVFDPEEFNFVAIRDRIRCYYKSFVQTARKRGLKLPEKKKG